MKIKEKIKQIFCRHMWKEEKSIELRTGREPTMFVWIEYKYYAVFEKCIKCELKRIREKRVVQV